MSTCRQILIKLGDTWRIRVVCHYELGRCTQMNSTVHILEPDGMWHLVAQRGLQFNSLEIFKHVSPDEIRRMTTYICEAAETLPILRMLIPKRPEGELTSTNITFEDGQPATIMWS